MRPTAFRIFDFKSITDSLQCELSGDNISVLAGQNESGKTSILTALRDFDLPEGTTLMLYASEKPSATDSNC